MRFGIYLSSPIARVVKRLAVSDPAPMLLARRICDTPPFQSGYIRTVLTSSV
jgi:hypothetical protein